MHENFYLSSVADGPELKEVVIAVKPKQLYLYGPYAKRYIKLLDGLCPIIKPLYENQQPTLF